ncbi:MAG: carbon-phosphorus lyase complex subunit PhnI [Alphaproteobacteria bacterium]|nr:carbon-phosphorus lyase complex subunit PhnI [Alphaproteobacteria bacterium]
MYVSVKGGAEAIDHAHAWQAAMRRGDADVPEISLAQIRQQMGLAVDRVMAEGACADAELAALALKQARGDTTEAAFLLRAYRNTLPRLSAAEPLDTAAMLVERRISATYKDLPGGQQLGPTFDYTHRLLDFALAAGGLPPQPAEAEEPVGPMPRVSDVLAAEGLMAREEAHHAEPPDLTRDGLRMPANRALRLQAMARGDEGFLLALGYSTQRGYGNAHPFVGEIRSGAVAVLITPPELGFTIDIGDIIVTECQMVNQFAGSAEAPPQFTRGYGLVPGRNERKAMAMSLVDRALRAAELGEEVTAPAQNAEFVLYHCDNVESTGFVEHLKLPHYVDFQSELEKLRSLRARWEAERAP